MAAIVGPLQVKVDDPGVLVVDRRDQGQVRRRLQQGADVVKEFVVIDAQDEEKRAFVPVDTF